MNEFERTTLLIGEENLDKLKKSRVAVFGVGGVGGHCAEALVRSGIGMIVLIDNDTVAQSNINRQLCALQSTVGRHKTEVLRERFLDINPSLEIETHNLFFTSESSFDFGRFDYVIDAIDTVSSKIEIVVRCDESETPVISAMGAGNKLSPARFEVSDIYKTSVCPLARVIRYELKKRGIKHLKTVYSREEPRKIAFFAKNGKPIPGSIAFVPSVCGLIMASEVVKDICGL
ncbi:MAG: tRNA threonylcarbamoyladenosine dehydratase [Ruminococcus sp.]|jgi:tRNA A37 threonylcarbamoyladenosine dehydratase|nr:tRNA threonylcarbamoyladenosine dehydratase [Ruminococcus sp.]